MKAALKILRFPTLSADTASRLIRRTPEATADKIVEACNGSGWDVYRPAHRAASAVYSTLVTPESLTRGWPETSAFRLCAGVVKEVARVASARGVICHDLPGRLFAIRQDLAIGLPKSFYFAAQMRTHVFDLQPRKSNLPTMKQLGLRASILLEALKSHPDLSTADIELVECGPRTVGGAHNGKLYTDTKLELQRGSTLVSTLQTYADAWDLLRAKRPEFVERVLKRQREKATKPDAQLYLF